MSKAQWKVVSTFASQKTIGEFSFYKRERIGFKRVQKETGSEFRNLFLFFVVCGLRLLFIPEQFVVITL